ncbi:hypothetical protein AKJ53_00585 [candidate division MSBL1 archaeon SCGC-AAA382F02]|uniref:PPC domain-containing protein n=1 Tax=candidate division MSBL1 archaeon SCGC-AAA382F02 TaxID=1698282 RepID=A0A133VIW1_9EURY|nr:hypothetical protein AKJ53_00585 [candidate division MSBL1 archaeon SCGC-AAA382F02]
MHIAEFENGKYLIIRAEHGSDLIEFITEVAEKKNIQAGTFTAMGALKNAKLGYYDQNSQEYREIPVNYSCEIASCVGNISLKEGEPFVHAHAVLADENGQTKGGHLSEGEIFAAEVHIRRFGESKLKRSYDEATGLALW